MKEPNFGVNPRRVRISPSLRSDEVNDKTEPHPLGKLEAVLGFPLHLGERISHCQKFVINFVQL